MDKIQIAELLDKYLKNNCTPEEADVVEAWYKQWEEQPDFTDTLADDKQRLLKERMFLIIRENTVPKESVILPERKVHIKWWIGIAAAALLFVVLKFFVANNPVQDATGPRLAITFSNHTKNVLKQQLPDSSIVWLSPEASITWPQKFDAKYRDITMTGNCFFEVTKNPGRPFIISSEHMVTKVWGTSFRVIDGKNSAVVKVTVVTGKVSVSKRQALAPVAKLNSNEVLLHPNEEVVLKSNTADLIASKNADVSDLALYDHIDLDFEKATLPYIVTVLNKKFAAHIIINSKQLNSAVMTASLTNLNLPEVLEVLKASMKINYEIEGDLIVLKKTN
ncbi:FecR family protein [Mucilaginibacter gracilis]|uniref:FecR family protein n=1 Tax=Mucilaginibacter gracilis TaxID=423350 RepID=A0A495J1T2_9SPHI|nr:FecR family protein [Mucilaginibacter gracilis]RKR82936.1 FecR family protein [Mucilaginibacter gracilis]